MKKFSKAIVATLAAAGLFAAGATNASATAPKSGHEVTPTDVTNATKGGSTSNGAGLFGTNATVNFTGIAVDDHTVGNPDNGPDITDPQDPGKTDPSGNLKIEYVSPFDFKDVGNSTKIQNVAAQGWKYNVANDPSDHYTANIAEVDDSRSTTPGWSLNVAMTQKFTMDANTGRSVDEDALNGAKINIPTPTAMLMGDHTSTPSQVTPVGDDSLSWDSQNSRGNDIVVMDASDGFGHGNTQAQWGTVDFNGDSTMGTSTNTLYEQNGTEAGNPKDKDMGATPKMGAGQSVSLQVPPVSFDKDHAPSYTAHLTWKLIASPDNA